MKILLKSVFNEELSENNPYRLNGYDDKITCCHRDCNGWSTWFYVCDGDVFFRCRQHKYPIDEKDYDEGEGPWTEMTRQEIAEEWEVARVMDA